MTLDAGDKKSTILQGLSGFWQRFFKDSGDIEAYYQASEIYLGQVYLDLLASILNIGLIDTPIFNREYWKLFLIKENDLNFVEGPSVAEDRYVYDMPGPIVSTDFLQNTIFDPDVLFERDVDFEIQDDDGLVRFIEDPFRSYQDTSGNWLPIPGVAWRSITIATGNQLKDPQQSGLWEEVTDVRRGDTLRLIGHRGVFVQEGASGSLVYDGVGAWYFEATGIGDSAYTKVGDTIEVYNATGADVIFNGVYIVKDLVTANKVELEQTGFIPFSSSAGSLIWKQYHTLYFEDARDYEVDYFENNAFIGSAEKPYPLDLNNPVIYAVIRTPADSSVIGAPVDFSDNPGDLKTTVLGEKYIVPGSLIIYAVNDDTGAPVSEDNGDYAVDYRRGIIYQLTAWRLTSIGRCDYSFKSEVFYTANGVLSEKISGYVKQLSLWTPEVSVDRFNLWYNYGYLLNRFDVSSETYKAFLRGIMHLYVSGPVLEHIEAGLNVAAGFPVVRFDGEILTGYDNGMISSGADGVLTETVDTFSSASFTFSELDVGGYIVIVDPLNDINKGYFKILEIIDSNTVSLETSYGFVTEAGLDWELSRTFKKVVTTSQRTYSYPYYVPVRDDITDINNYNRLTFQAFEVLTTAFTVTDYIEDSQWWVNKFVPRLFWDEDNLLRRLARTELFENIFDPDDYACFDDPGFFFDADDEGNVFNPTDDLGEPVNDYRHCAAFILFDRFLKLHMFSVDYNTAIPLTEQFTQDMNELVLVAKPSYTYPYVEPGGVFEDIVWLNDELTFPKFGLVFGGDNDGKSDSVMLAANDLIFDSDFPWNFDDYYKYEADSTVPVPGAPSPVTPGYSFTIPLSANERPLNLVIHATVSGVPVLEGCDYTVNWLKEDPSAWEVTALTTWDAVSPLNVSLESVSEENTTVVPTPDTVVGWTPIAFDGKHPFYIRTGALDPDSPDYATEFALVRTEHIDRAVMLKVDTDTGVPGGIPYVY